MKAQNITERLFIGRASQLLPVETAEIGRNDYGVLYFKWESPCPSVGALWVSVTPKEITLSCKIAHLHVSTTSYLHDGRITNIDLKRLIVRDGIREAQNFLKGDVAATIAYDENGREHSYGWCPKDKLSLALEYTRKIFGQKMTERAWIWTGEVNLGTRPSITGVQAP